MIFGKRKKAFKAWAPREKYPVEPVFRVAGRTFYAFSDANNIPAGRQLAAIPIYVELKTNSDHKYLSHFVAAMEATLNDPKSISIEKLISLKNQIKDRLDWAYNPDLVYKYASVVYFDENECTSTYDEAYNEQKIAFWKEHAGAHDFFLAEPIQNLIPVLKTVKGSIPNYSHVVLKAQAMQLEYLSRLLFSKQNLTEEEQSLSSQISNQRMQHLSDASRFQNTSTSSKSGISLIEKE